MQVDSTGRRPLAATGQPPFRRFLTSLASTLGLIGVERQHGSAPAVEMDTPSGIWDFIAASKASGSSAGLSQLPKIALLFLTRGPLPFEATWKLFLEGMNLPQLGESCWHASLVERART